MPHGWIVQIQHWCMTFSKSFDASQEVNLWSTYIFLTPCPVHGNTRNYMFWIKIWPTLENSCRIPWVRARQYISSGTFRSSQSHNMWHHLHQNGSPEHQSLHPFIWPMIIQEWALLFWRHPGTFTKAIFIPSVHPPTLPNPILGSWCHHPWHWRTRPMLLRLELYNWGSYFASGYFWKFLHEGSPQMWQNLAKRVA